MIPPAAKRALDECLFAGRVRSRAFHALLVALVAGTAIYWFLGTTLLHGTNRNRLASDQQYNIVLAEESAGQLWPAYSEGIVNPLWPWVASHFLVDGDDEATFWCGRRFNLAVGWLFLIGLAFWLARRLPLLPVLSVLALAGLGCFLPQGVYFQPETLYYVFFIVSWILCWRLLDSNPLREYAALGACAGLAYLAKGSVTPLVAGFVVISALRWAAVLWTPLRERGPPPPDWKPRRHLAGLALMGAVMLAVTGPFLAHNAKQFGDPFHSFPKYWMWQDDFGKESIPFMNRFNHPGQRAQLAPEDIPSAANYLRRAGWGGAWERLATGTRAKVSAFLLPEKEIKKHRRGRPWKEVLRHRGLYPLLLLLGMALLAWPAWCASAPGDRWSGTLKAMMWLGPVAVFSLLYGWYDPIGRGDRFMMSLYVPLILFPVLGGAAMMHAAGNPGRWIFGTVQLAVLALWLHRIGQVLANPQFAA